MKLQAVILSGGSGTRLWPQSREQHPKQLLALASDVTMLQATALRLDGLTGLDIQDPMVVCNNDYRFLIADQLHAVNKKNMRLVIEPNQRNTAPALTLAALACRDDDPVMLVMPADHIMHDIPAFHQAIQAGMPLAAAGDVVTFGVVPSCAHTGYGYLQVDGHVGVRSLVSFIEKPDAPTAKRYVDSGEYLWNSGMFMFKASTWLDAIQQLNIDMYQACSLAMSRANQQDVFIFADEAAFQQSPADSIDYAVMEKLASIGVQAKVVPLDCGWSDVGSWDSLWEVSAKDSHGNVVMGDVLLENVQNSLVMSDHRLVACVGVSDVVVIETPDAVLVLNKSLAQYVKLIVDRLKREGRPQSLNHRRVSRPWGMYDSVDAGPGFQVKRIVVNPGASLSLQKHYHRSEHWVVVNGTAEVVRGDETILLRPNESTYIPLGVKHRLTNPGKLPLEVIEVQSGAYLGEDDIERFEDTYGRQ